MRILVILWILGCLAACSRPDQEAEESWDKEMYGDAASRYAKILEERPGEDINDYNLGTALAAQTLCDSALPYLKNVIGSRDTILLADTWYNIAHCHYQSGRADTNAYIRLNRYREALASLESSLRVNPDLEVAAENYEIIHNQTQLLLDSLQQAEEKQKQKDEKKRQKEEEEKKRLEDILRQMKELLLQEKYAEARDLLIRESANLSNPQKLSPYLQRIQDVMDIAAGREPERKIDAGQAKKEMGVL